MILGLLPQEAPIMNAEKLKHICFLFFAFLGHDRVSKMKTSVHVHTVLGETKAALHRATSMPCHNMQ